MKRYILFPMIVGCLLVPARGAEAQRPATTVQTPQRKATLRNKTVQRSSDQPQVHRYFPVLKGARWKYRISFPAGVDLPYYPEFEKPKGLVSADGITGMGSWDKGDVDFEILVEDVIETSANSSTWAASLDESAHRFVFYIQLKDPSRGRHQIHLKTEKEDVALDLKFLIGAPDNPTMILARTIAKLTPATRAQKYDVSVAAGQFKNCLKSVVGANSQNGQYPVEAFLAPDVGIVKVIGKNPQGETVYTLELTEFAPGKLQPQT